MESKKLSIEEICLKLKPVFGKKIDEIYLRYAMSDSREEREEIESIVNALYNKHLSELLNKKILLEPPTNQEIYGEYPIAVVNYADKKLYPFSLREMDWVRHVCISGMSGSGKTTLALNIAKKFVEMGKSFMIFDWKKSFRPILTLDSEILLFTIGNENISNHLKININQPPNGIAPKEWLNILCDLISESFFVSYGVHKILLETLDEAFADFGIYRNSGNYPTWNEIKRRLEMKMKEVSGREANWLMSALRVAHVMTFGNFGKAINYKGKDTVRVEDLLDKKVIFELNSLGNIEKKFFCEFLLTYIYKFRKASQVDAKKEFKHAIIVDEAHNVFLKEKTHFVKESVTDMIYREMREYGTALICLDQHISMISDTVVGNSACHIAFQQQLPQDIETISRLMQLWDRKQYFSMVPVGSAIVKLSERYTYPFLVNVPDSELRQIIVNDKEIESRMKFLIQSRQVQAGTDAEFNAKLMPRIEHEIKQEMNHLGKDEDSGNLPARQQLPVARAFGREEGIQGILQQDNNLKVMRSPEKGNEIQGISQKSRISEDYQNVKNQDSRAHSEFHEEFRCLENSEAPARPQFTAMNSSKADEINDVRYEDFENLQSKQQLPVARAFGRVDFHISEKLEHNTSEVSEPLESEKLEIGADEIENLAKVSRKKNYGIELSPVQRILFEYVKRKLESGMNPEDVRETLEENAEAQGYCNFLDIARVIKHALELIRYEREASFMDEEISSEISHETAKIQPKATFINSRVVKTMGPARPQETINDEEKFLKFLKENPSHNHSIVELYKLLGLSARKGNKLKEKLEHENRIRVEEIKSDKGWRKIVRLA